MTDESYLKRAEMLKKKKPEERFLIMADLIEGQLAAMKAGIAYKNPRFTKGEAEKCLKERMLKIYSSKP